MRIWRVAALGCGLAVALGGVWSVRAVWREVNGITGGHLLTSAVMAGDLAGAKLQIAQGAKVNVIFGMPLRQAASRGDLAMAGLLLDNGAAPNGIQGSGTTPLLEAAGAGHLPVVRLLLERGADPNEGRRTETPLSCARANQHSAVVRFLKQRGARER